MKLNLLLSASALFASTISANRFLQNATATMATMTAATSMASMDMSYESPHTNLTLSGVFPNPTAYQIYEYEYYTMRTADGVRQYHNELRIKGFNLTGYLADGTNSFYFDIENPNLSKAPAIDIMRCVALSTRNNATANFTCFDMYASTSESVPVQDTQNDVSFVSGKSSLIFYTVGTTNFVDIRAHCHRKYDADAITQDIQIPEGSTINLDFSFGQLKGATRVNKFSAGSVAAKTPVIDSSNAFKLLSNLAILPCFSSIFLICYNLTFNFILFEKYLIFMFS